MSGKDYYKELDIPKSATDADIRKAFKKLVKKYHPDAHPDDKDAAEKFNRIQEAYSVLSNSEKRSQYDRFGSSFQGGSGPQFGQNGPVDLGDLFGGMNMGDLFGGAFGGGRQAQQPRPRKGEDIRLDVDISFNTAAEGGNHSVQLNKGSGTEKLNIKIPPGVNTGSVIRLGGQGHAGFHGGPSGNLLITLNVAAHPYFRRENNNILLDVPITPDEAVLGTKVEVPTLSDGKVMLTIPPETSTGAKLRLKGKGIVDQKTKTPGDQLVVIKIVLPKNMDEKSKELYQQIFEVEKESPRTNLW